MRADTPLCECSPFINVLSNRLPSEREDALVQGLALLPNSHRMRRKTIRAKTHSLSSFWTPTSRNSPFFRILVPHAPQNNSCKNSLFIIVLDRPQGNFLKARGKTSSKECLPLRLSQKAAAGVRNGRSRKGKTKIRV